MSVIKKINLPTVKPSGILKNKRVIVRLALNVPIVSGKVGDAYRIEQTLPTLRLLKKSGAKIIAISHLGKDGKASLAPVVEYLNERIPTKLIADTTHENTIKELVDQKPGSVAVIENIRRYIGEENNNNALAKELSELGDYYVNEDFAAAHRAHASVVGIPKYLKSFAGLNFSEEVTNLSRVFKPKHPFVFVLGGAKFSTKIPLVKRFLKSADKIFISGALANNFFKAQGLEVGQSLVDTDLLELNSFISNKKIVLPKDVIVRGPRGSFIKLPNEVMPDETILDVGPLSLSEIENVCSTAKMILWNGPLGKYEEGFTQATERLATIIAQVGKKNRAETIVGGGDTVAAIEKLNLFKKFTWVSTGGGAMLDFLAQGTLPGIEAILKSKKK